MPFEVEDTSAVPMSAAVAVCSALLWLLQLPFVCLGLLFGGPVAELLVFGSPPPDPPVVAALGRPRSFLSPAEAAALRPHEKALTVQLAALLERQLLSGRQLGVVVNVYYQGREVAHVGGGVHRPSGEKAKGGAGAATSDGPKAPPLQPPTAAAHAGLPRGWQAVNADTRFLIQSVTKGVCACGVLALADRHLLDYDAPVAKYWPAFASLAPAAAQAGKASLTVAEALSHRAGLTCAGGDVPVAVLRSLYHYARGGWASAWSALVACVALATPEWEPGQFAAYHPVAFSWILGGTTDALLNGLGFSAEGRSNEEKLGAAVAADAGQPGRIRGVVAALVAAPLGIPADEAMVGRVPPHLDFCVARNEAPPCPSHQLRRTQAAAVGGGAPAGSLLRWFLVNVVGACEAGVLCWLFALPWWRRLCLPSSNGAFTCRAVGRIFGALANSGAVRSRHGSHGSGQQNGKQNGKQNGQQNGNSHGKQNGKPNGQQNGKNGNGSKQQGGESSLGEDRFVSAAALAAVAARVAASGGVRPGAAALPGRHPDGTFPNARARLSCGFFPWACPDLHGACGVRGGVLNHEGMGGCAAYADPASGLAVVVLKNVYEPLSVLGGSVSPDVCEIMATVRAALGIA